MATLFQYAPGDAIVGAFTRTGTGSYVDSSGVVQRNAAANDIARDAHYEPWGVDGSLVRTLLLEGAATDMLVRFDEFDNASWTKTSCSVTANATTGPNGTSSADKIVEAAASAAHFIGQTITFTSGTAYTLQVYAKAAERSKLRLSFPTTIFASTARAVTFDLIAGTVVGAEADCTARIKAFPNGWFLCSFTKVCASNGSGAASFTLKTTDTTAAESYAGNGTSGLYLSGAQCVASGFPSSDIPTTAATAARSVDSLTWTQSTAVGALVQYELYWDQALFGWVETATAIANGASYPIQPTTGRAYRSIKVVSAGDASDTPPFMPGFPLVTATSSAARIAVQASRACTIKLEYSTASNLSGPTTTAGTAVTSSTDYTATIDLTGLAANTTYYYRVLLDNVPMATSLYRSFSTFISGSGVVKFAFSSCTVQEAGSGAGIDNTFAAVPSDVAFVLNIGDTIYADEGTSGAASVLEDFREKHRKAMRAGNSYTSGLQTLARTKPVFTIWDDHDITDNFNGGTGNALYSPARQAFLERHGAANPAPYNSGHSGSFYYTFSCGQVDFFVLDQRSYRTVSGTILGTTQKAALKAWLSASTAKVKIIASPSPAHGYATTGNDAWGGQTGVGTGYTTERNEILDYIDANNISGVLIISADQHWSGAFKYSYGSRSRFEFMASPWSKSTRTVTSTAADSVNGPVLWKYGSTSNFGVVTIDTTQADPTISFQLYSASGSLGSGNKTDITLADLNAGLTIQATSTGSFFFAS